MGANEHGVVIGNEAVFTRVPYDKGPGLIGMDFIRLALERARNAQAALETIVGLLETYGQGGNCGFAHAFYYHNSFLIGDRTEAWVLETAGRQWAAVKVEDVRSISNALTIGKEWELASPGLVDYAVSKGWCKRGQDFDFAGCYSDFLYTTLSDARARQTCTLDSLKQKKGQITVEMVMGVLRSHAKAGDARWGPAGGLTGADVCMHAGFGPVRTSQSVGSMVAHISAEGMTHWLTGTSAPCTGIFKPVWLESGLPETGPAPSGEYDPAALWWRHEALHREVLRDYSARLALYKGERDALEEEFLREEAGCKGSSPAERLAFSTRCFERAELGRPGMDAARQRGARAPPGAFLLSFGLARF